MKLSGRIKFIDFLAASAASLFLTVKCYAVLYGITGWKNLPDFYTGITIYNNHNKYLDIYIYFVYLLLLFIMLPLVSMVTDKIFKHKENEKPAEFRLLEKIKTFLPKLKNLQYAAVSGFLLLHPLNGHFYPKIAVLSAVLILASVFDIYRRNKQGKGFSPFAIAALFFIFSFSTYKVWYAPVDDHHFGETFAVYFMHSTFNMEYYKDIMLVHGLKDTAAAFFGDFFFNENNISGYIQGEFLNRNIVFILSVLFSLIVFNGNILYAAPLLMLKVPSLAVLYVLIYFVLLKKEFLEKPAVLFWLYFICALFLGAYWTTVGSFWVLASLPLFIYACFKLQNRKKHLAAAGLVLLLLSIIFRNSVFEYFHQAQYYIESTLYAFGNGFGTPAGKMPAKFAWEWLYKMAALFLLPVIILKALEFIKQKKRDAASFLFISFSVLYVLVSLKYTLGRLDEGGFFRIEYISLGFLCVIIPYLIHFYTEKTVRIKFEKLFFVMIAGFFAVSAVYSLPLNITEIGMPDAREESGLFNTGGAMIDAEAKKRLLEIKDYLYSKNPEETFLDLTNRGMHYLYFNKKMPVQFSSFYNITSSKQALETAERLRKNPPDNILIYSKNALHDNVFPSLRINPLYRDIFLKHKYEYKEAGAGVFLSKTDKKPEYTQEQLDNLDYYSGLKRLKYLPEVWAESMKTLPLTEIITDFTIENYGHQIKIIFSKPQRIRDLDLLYFDTADKKPASAAISINGSNSEILCRSKSGRMLVPLDNYPSWLLNNDLREITIETDRIIKQPEISFFIRNINHS